MKYFIKSRFEFVLLVLMALMPGMPRHAAAAQPTATAKASDVEDYWIAIRNDRVSNLQSLLKRPGITPNLPDGDTNTPLMDAIKADAWKAYDVLLADRRIDVNLKNRVGENALMYLAIKGETQRMQALIERGAEVNQPGWTALHYAAAKGHDEAVKLLLDRYAYIDAESPDKTTPLMMALRYDQASTAKLLLDAGADGYFRNAQGKNGIDLARDAGNTSLANDFTKRLNAQKGLREQEEQKRQALRRQGGE